MSDKTSDLIPFSRFLQGNVDKQITNLVDQLKKYATRNNIKSFIVGVSGGVDSAVVLGLCARTNINTYGLYLPYSNIDFPFCSIVNKDDLNEIEKFKDYVDILTHYKSLINNYNENVSLECINIKDIVDEFKSVRRFARDDKVAIGNIMARVRMIILYDYARGHNGIVVGTSNKSEYELGYFTKWGDGAADIRPLVELLKTEVFTLARNMLDIPRSIINKAPSAGLWEGQTDEGEMGVTYEEIDKYLSGDRSISTDATMKINEMINKTLHKRYTPMISRW